MDTNNELNFDGDHRKHFILTRYSCCWWIFYSVLDIRKMFDRD